MNQGVRKAVRNQHKTRRASALLKMGYRPSGPAMLVTRSQRGQAEYQRPRSWIGNKLADINQGLLLALRDCQTDLNAQSVHGLRIASRRLLSVLKLLKPWLYGLDRRQAMATLQGLLALTNPARNLDVYTKALERLDARHAEPGALAIAMRERASEYAVLARALGSAHHLATLLEFGACMDTLCRDEALEEVAHLAIEERIRKKLRHLERHLAKARHLSRLSHSLRLEVKQVRYAIEGLCELDSPATQRAIVELQGLQRALGADRDIRKLVQRAARSTGSGRRALKQRNSTLRSKLQSAERSAFRATRIALSQPSCQI